MHIFLSIVFIVVGYFLNKLRIIVKEKIDWIIKIMDIISNNST